MITDSNAMTKGQMTIDGQSYYFDETTGICTSRWPEAAVTGNLKEPVPVC